MKKTVFILGLLIAFMPFLGFPRPWKTAFFVAVGIFLALTALLRRNTVLATPPDKGEMSEAKEGVGDEMTPPPQSDRLGHLPLEGEEDKIL